VSPLWSDADLAEAAWANAVERGLVDEKAKARLTVLERVRRIPRPRVHSFAL
jgi:hypothetical protein